MKYRFHFETDSIRGVVIIIMTVAMPLYFMLSCGRAKKEFIDFAYDKETSYNVRTTDVTMFISDSGITRFKLDTKEWYIFDEASEPYYFFPEKVHGEQFDSLFNVETSFDADTAYYYYKKKLWKFIDNVQAVNIAEEQFETSLLFWDDNEGRIYSDRFIRITKGEFINTGIGFESNQTLTNYRIFNSTAEIPVDETTPEEE